MEKKRIKSSIKILTGTLATAATLSAPFFLYLKVLPWAVSNDKVIHYVENIVQKAYYIDLDIKKPILKTSLSPNLSFSVDKISATSNKNSLVDINKLDINISLAQLLKKKIILKKATIDYFYADVNKIMELPAFKQQQPQQKYDWNIDVFQSVLGVNNAEIIYSIDKNTIVKINAKDLIIDDNINKKHVKYNIDTDITKEKNKINIQTSDNGGVYLLNKDKFVIENSPIVINKNQKVTLSGEIDSKSNYNIKLSSKNFSIPYVIDLLNSQIIENDLQTQLVYFKDIDGTFDFNIKVDNKNLDGKINLNKLSFKLVPFLDLPVLLNSGNISFDYNKVYLKGFKGYYNNKKTNKMDFEGTVTDYLKSVDTDLVGNAIVTNDFAKNYLSKMAGTDIAMEGSADTRVKLKSKYNKIDLTWLYRFKKGNGFIIDGEESTMNDLANRVLVAKMHFENTLLSIKSLDYYAGNPEDKNPNARIPIISFNSNIDFADNKTFVKDFELELPKPMPAGFINMLIKQKLFKGGTFTGKMQVLNTGKYPVLKGKMQLHEVRVPSQRLYIRNGQIEAKNGLIHLSSNGRYRRSEYKAFGDIVNEIKFPIIVKDAELAIDCIDVEKYLKIFNNQIPSEQAAADVKDAVAKSIEKNSNLTEDDDSDIQTFDLANLIIEKCTLKAAKGFYKDINFANVVGNLTLDKNSMLKIESNKFDIAEGTSSAKIKCDLKNHKYNIWLALIQVNSDLIASTILNLPNEINGKASGLMELDTDDSLKLNGRIQFRVYEGIIAKIGLVEYAMKVAALFRNPLTMVTPSVISDLVSIPEGKFNQIDGDLRLKNNVVAPMMIKSSSPQLSSFIIGTYDLEAQDAALRIYTKFSNRKKGMYGFLRNLSLNSLANRIPLSSRNDSDYYSAEISQLPEIDADEKDCQIFLTKVDGDIVQNNFLSSLKKIK